MRLANLDNAGEVEGVDALVQRRRVLFPGNRAHADRAIHNFFFSLLLLLSLLFGLSRIQRSQGIRLINIVEKKKFQQQKSADWGWGLLHGVQFY